MVGPMALPSIGITGYDNVHFAVENMARSRAFYLEKFDFQEVARAGADLVAKSGQEAAVFGAGGVRVCVSSPLTQTSKASRYLRRHPAGIMSLGVSVADLDKSIAALEARGATFVADVVEDSDGHGIFRAIEIATPLGDVNFRFVERKGYRKFAPGFEDFGTGHANDPTNRFGISAIDHITSNGLTMKPIVDWYATTLGFEQFWDIEFHTQDVLGKGAAGTGLKSIVMWDPESGVKFATNEPKRPQFRDSQIAKFVDDNQGNGVQHIAFSVTDILSTVEEMNRRGIDFMTTPKSYFDDLPRRLEELKITNVTQDLKELERLHILLDGGNDKYMLQIFLKEAAVLYGEQKAGPFFYEIIQRAGDPGFGYGNFSALFRSIERAQKAKDLAQRNPAGAA